MYDIIVIGAGAAGLTSAIYGGRAGKKVLVIESTTFGGQIINTPEIENYPGIKNISGFEYAKNLYDQAIMSGCEYVTDSVVKIVDSNTVQTKTNEYKGRCIIIATGLKKRTLGLYAESDFVGKGVSYCATCDGNFFRGKKVAVVGGGNTAIEDVLYLSDICEQVYLIHRRDEFRADEKTLDILKTKENVECILNTSVVSLNGENVLESVTLRNKENEDFELKVDGLFIAIGQIPDNLKFSNVVDIDEDGYIISSDCTTKTQNIFVAGDARTKDLRQLVTAASDGAIAANKAINYLNKR